MKSFGIYSNKNLYKFIIHCIYKQVKIDLDKNGILPVSCADPEGETGGLDPLENHKVTKPAFNVGKS